MCKTKITGAITVEAEDLKCDCGGTHLVINASPSQYKGMSYAKSCYVAFGYVKCAECGKVLKEFASR